MAAIRQDSRESAWDGDACVQGKAIAINPSWQRLYARRESCTAMYNLTWLCIIIADMKILRGMRERLCGTVS